MDERELAAFEAFVEQKGVSPWPTTQMDVAYVRRSIEQLDALLLRLQKLNSPAVSPRKGMAFVGRDEVISYVADVRDNYLSLLETLQHREQMSVIEEAVEQKVTDPDVRRELSDLVAELRRQQEDLLASIQARETFETDELLRLDIMKRRWDVRKAMLEREPAAVLVGGVLLLGIACALVVATFTHTPVPEILASGFLLILGFFFGQNSTRGGRSGNAD